MGRERWVDAAERGMVMVLVGTWVVMGAASHVRAGAGLWCTEDVGCHPVVGLEGPGEVSRERRVMSVGRHRLASRDVACEVEWRFD